MRKLLPLFSVFFLLLLPLLDAHAWSAKYDLYFKRWGQVYFPFENWKRWKAQGIAESNLNSLARSRCGALGVMQLMPATAKELGVNPYDPESNIRGGIKYDAKLYKIWAKIPIKTERFNFTYASYNAGPGWIIKASKMAQSIEWSAAAEKLPLITGKHAAETTGYVKKINSIYRQIQ